MQKNSFSIWPIFPNDSESLPKVCYIKRKNSEILSRLGALVWSPQTYSFRGKASEPPPQPLHATANTFPRIFFLFVPLIIAHSHSCTKLPYFQPQVLPSSPNSSQRRLQALQKWRCLCVNSEKRSSANKCKWLPRSQFSKSKEIATDADVAFPFWQWSKLSL